MTYFLNLKVIHLHTLLVGSRPVPFKRVIAQSIGFGPTRTQSQIEESFSKSILLTKKHLATF